MAVKSLLDYVEDNYNTSEDRKELLRGAFARSKEVIEQEANRTENEHSDYDTTLSAIIYDGENILYGHSGDGGIIALTDEGRYINITKVQKGADGSSVVPLRAGHDHWVFGDFKNVSSVLMATDGIYDVMNPYLLKGQDTEVYVPLARRLMDNNILNVSKDNILQIQNDMMEFFDSDQLSSVTDDKTILVLINSKKFAAILDDDYYAVPDFNRLRQEWDKKVYPHMFKKTVDEVEQKSFESDSSKDDMDLKDVPEMASDEESFTEKEVLSEEYMNPKDDPEIHQGNKTPNEDCRSDPST